MHPSPSGSGSPKQFNFDDLDLDNFDFADFDALEASIHQQDTQANVFPLDVRTHQNGEASGDATVPVDDENDIHFDDSHINVSTAEILALFPEWAESSNDEGVEFDEASPTQAPSPEQAESSNEPQDDEAKLQALLTQNRILNERAAVRYAEERRQKAEKERAELKVRKAKMEAEKKAEQEALHARIARRQEREERARKKKESEEEQKRQASAAAVKKILETRARSQTMPQPRSILKSRNSLATKRRRNSQDDFRVRFETGKALKKVKIFDKDQPASIVSKTAQLQDDTEAMEVDTATQASEVSQSIVPAIASEPQQLTVPATTAQPLQSSSPSMAAQKRQRANTSVATPARSNQVQNTSTIGSSFRTPPRNEDHIPALTNRIPGAAFPAYFDPQIPDYVPSFARSEQSPASGVVRSASGRSYMINPQMHPIHTPSLVGNSPYTSPYATIQGTAAHGPAQMPLDYTPSFVGNSPYTTIGDTATQGPAQRGRSNTVPQPSSGITRSGDLSQQLQWQNVTPTDHVAAPSTIVPQIPAPTLKRQYDNVSDASRAAYVPIAQAVRGMFPEALPPIHRAPPPPLQFETDTSIPVCEKCRKLHKRCQHRKSPVSRSRQSSDQVCDDCRIKKRRCTHNGVTPTQTIPSPTDVSAKKKRKTSQTFTRRHEGFKCDNCRRLKQTCTHDDPSLLAQQMSDGDLMHSVTDFRAQIGTLQGTLNGLGGEVVGGSRENDALIRQRRDLERRIMALEESFNRMLAELAQRGFVLPN